MCGDRRGGNAAFEWACPGLGRCEDHVRKNGTALRDAYWDIRSARVFQKAPTDPFDPVCSVCVEYERDVEYPSNELRTIESIEPPTPEGCWQHCQRDAECAGFVFDGGKGEEGKVSCVLKHGLESRKVSKGKVAGINKCTKQAPKCVVFEADYAYTSQSALSPSPLADRRDVTSPYSCWQLCDTHAGCSAFTFHGQDRRCVLMREPLSRQYEPNKGKVSGFKQCEHDRVLDCFAFERHYEVLGAPMASILAPSPTQCAAACAARGRCRAVSYEWDTQRCELQAEGHHRVYRGQRRAVMAAIKTCDK
uniref:Apple domain-containing protein n=1 Tax=Vitrella brassicaformis TaxID=1169539 RepID=A0A7S1NY54_9ALVE